MKHPEGKSSRCRIAATLLALSALAGCGGSGGDPAPEPALASGSRDIAYGGGKITLARPSWTANMAVAQDGSAFVTNAESGQGIVKLDASGNIVGGYGTGGRVDLPSTSPVLDGQGNLFVITTLRTPRSIAKLDATGRLDPTFGDNGHATLPAWSSGLVNTFEALARDGAGNLYVAGTTGASLESTRAAITRFDPLGRRATYGIGGAVVVNALDGLRFRALAVDTQGNAYLGFSPFEVPSALASALMRVDSTGTSVEVHSLGVACTLMDIALESPSRVVVGGSCAQGPSVLKWERGQGVLPFRDAGMRAGLFGPNVGVFPGSVSRVIVVGGGVVYAAGRNGCSGEYAVAKVDSNGDLVMTFGGVGYVLLPGPSDGVQNMAFDGRSRLYVGGPGDRACVNSHPTSSAFHIFRVGG